VAVWQRSQRVAPGQHFLRSSRLAAELVLDAGIRTDELVVDVGAGTGVLTRALVDAGAEVVARERDPKLAAELRRRFSGHPVAVVQADARSWSWPRTPFSVVSNLPFAGSGEILDGLLRDPRGGLRRAAVIVQWEFAAKHTAVWPATMRGTYWRAWFDLAVVRRLAPSAFSPPPSVHAALLQVTRRPRPRVAVEESDRYRRLLAHVFGANTHLTRALRGRLTPREVRRLAALHGFSASARARDLDAEQWSEIYAFASARGKA
jgi:23S rRNA (adenine-N6)-dimethyltransferase